MNPLDDVLARLIRTKSSAHPVVSCFLDTAPGGTGRRTFPAFLRKGFRRRLESFAPRSEPRAQLEIDRDRILAWLEEELDASTRGVAIYASHGDGLWEAVSLHVPFDEHGLAIGPLPVLYPLVELMDRWPSHVVCVADVREALLLVCRLGEVLVEETRAAPTPLHQTRNAGWAEVSMGGWLEEHVHEHARELVEHLKRVARDFKAEYVILGGDEPMLSELVHHAERVFEGKIIGPEHFERFAQTHDVLAKVTPLLLQREVEDSQRAADAIVGRFREGGAAVAGLDRTIAALNRADVDVLLLAARWSGETGWQCSTCRALGRQPVPRDCPYCGSPLPDEVDLREAMVRRAERVGRKVEVVESPSQLDAFDGVGATLRYPMAQA